MNDTPTTQEHGDFLEQATFLELRKKLLEIEGLYRTMVPTEERDIYPNRQVSNASSLASEALILLGSAKFVSLPFVDDGRKKKEGPSPWIAIKDRLPIQEDGRVLFRQCERGTNPGEVRDFGWDCVDRFNVVWTHWMPIPPLPRSDSPAAETPSPQASSPVKELAPHDPFDQWLTSNRKHEVNTDNIYVASEAFEAGMKYERSVIKGVESKAE